MADKNFPDLWGSPEKRKRAEEQLRNGGFKAVKNGKGVFELVNDNVDNKVAIDSNAPEQATYKSGDKRNPIIVPDEKLNSSVKNSKPVITAEQNIPSSDAMVWEEVKSRKSLNKRWEIIAEERKNSNKSRIIIAEKKEPTR